MEKDPLHDRLLADRRLEEWNRLAAVVTHEINNPLAAIGNLLFLMQIMPGVTPEITGVAQQISDEVKRIEALSRLALGFLRQRSQPEVVDMLAAAEGVRLLLGPVLRQRSLELEVSSEGDCTVHAFAADLRQVFLDLTRTACDGSLKGGRVDIRLNGNAEDTITIEVQDHGSGMAAEELEQVSPFDPNGADPKSKALGLWLTRRLVEAQGGTLHIQSSPGQGTHFTATWPRRRPDASPASAQTAASGQA